MTAFQKILIAIPVIIYAVIICILVYSAMHSPDAHEVLTIFGTAGIAMICLILLVLILTIIIRVIFFLQISQTGSVIIALWIPFMIAFLTFAGFLVCDPGTGKADNSQTEKYESINPQDNWHYTGKDQKVLIAAQKYTEDTLLCDHHHRKYFTSVHVSPDDSAIYEAYYFYADDNHPDTASMMVVYIVSDSGGHILSHEQECTMDSVHLREVFYEHVKLFNIMNELTKPYFRKSFFSP